LGKTNAPWKAGRPRRIDVDKEYPAGDPQMEIDGLQDGFQSRPDGQGSRPLVTQGLADH